MSEDKKDDIKTVDVKTDSRRGRDRFRGDFDRNEVQLDLEKFLDMMEENSKLKERLREAEQTSGYVFWTKLARTIDAWRIFPRIFIALYLVVFYRSFEWFIALPEPTTQQAGLISTVIGAGAVWFGLYVNSKGDGGK